MEEAVDVYDGCKLDYTGDDVTPRKFIAVLTGDADGAGGKVLQSKAGDHVFVNFVDHGARGLIAFPGDDVLHAKTLISTLKKMHAHGMYKELTFYLEACESGSMFEDLLPKSLPVYAVTAANAHESSYGTYCNSESRVGDQEVGSCLGDLFSVNWMEDSDKYDSTAETMNQQFAHVKALTRESHVMRYGKVKQIGSEPVSNFQGPEDDANISELSDVQALPQQELSHTSVGFSRCEAGLLEARVLEEGYSRGQGASRRGVEGAPSGERVGCIAPGLHGTGLPEPASDRGTARHHVRFLWLWDLD